MTGVPELAARVAGAVRPGTPKHDRGVGPGRRRPPGAWGAATEPASGRRGGDRGPVRGLFTLADEAERSALIAALCELARDTLVVLALRADFYGQAIVYPGLLRALQDGTWCSGR